MIFDGHVRTSSNKDSDGWLRREIVVKQDPETKYPGLRVEWNLIDQDNVNYVVQFIKGADTGWSEPLKLDTLG